MSKIEIIDGARYAISVIPTDENDLKFFGPFVITVQATATDKSVDDLIDAWSDRFGAHLLGVEVESVVMVAPGEQCAECDAEAEAQKAATVENFRAEAYRLAAEDEELIRMRADSREKQQEKFDTLWAEVVGKFGSEDALRESLEAMGLTIRTDFKQMESFTVSSPYPDQIETESIVYLGEANGTAAWAVDGDIVYVPKTLVGVGIAIGFIS